MKKIAVLFSGRGSNLSYLIKSLPERNIEVALAITDNRSAEGIKIARDANVPLKILDLQSYPDRESFDAKIVKLLQAYDPDLTVLAGFMRILGPIFTENIRAINLHPSLLPRHKGLNAIEKSYFDSYPDGGVTVHWVSNELDGGDMILQKHIFKKDLSLKDFIDTVKREEKSILSKSIVEILDSK